MEKPPVRKSAMARRLEAEKKPPPCKVKHSESRRLPVATAETDAGALDISIEFLVSKRGHRRKRPRPDGAEPAPRVGRSAVLSQLKVRTQAALPTPGGSAGAVPADGWTLMQVTRSSDRKATRRADATTAATSTVSVQRSEAPGAATAGDAEPGGDTGDSGIVSGKRRRRRPSTAAGSRNISQSLRELERISRRLGCKIPANTKVARAPSASADQMARTRDHLLLLRSLTDNALMLIGQYCQAPTVTKAPPQPFESLTLDSQQVQPSEAGATFTLGTQMAQTPKTVAAVPSAAVRCHASPDWHSAKPLPASQWGQSERCACVIEDPHPPAANGQRPSGLAVRSPRPVRGRTLRHSGRHPIVSWALCGDATAGRFPTVERRPVRIAAAAGPRPPLQPWLLARPLEMDGLRWLSRDLAASATSRPLGPATLYGICGVRQAAPLLLDRLASQRLLAPCGGRCGAAPRWRTVPLATAVAWLRTEVTVVGLESSLVTMETTASSAQVIECHAASQCLRMAVLQMPQPAAARTLQPLTQPSELSTAVAKSAVAGCCWPTQSSGDDGGGGFSKSAAAPDTVMTGDAGGDKPDPQQQNDSTIM